ncbi:sigma-70 family RNA polymerase sigma factor [Actinomadura roseirufa]|uniref:sigma-70 family RNA polymerase sigma factor n=1 Tax=Actinomadura roseirufa TaxID=2094049 RepID=UPI00104194EC|nr:sigma-70 family RNA polymerase sigma factor [Actinomadura roseirufa]
MGRAEEAGDPPRPDPPQIEHGKRPDQATPASTSPHLPPQHADTETDAEDDLDQEQDGVDSGLAGTERQMRALEAELAAVELENQDFFGSEAAVSAERVRHRAEQQRLVLEMRAEGFKGPITTTWKAETVAYALAVLMNWTRTGQIVKECMARGRPISLAEYGPGRWTSEDRLELVGETVTRALRYFTTKVLAAGRWDPNKGASLNTFFIGACLFQFPNVYNRWAREQNGWDRYGCSERSPEVAEAALTTTTTRWEDPTSEPALTRARRRQILEEIANPQTRTAAQMILDDRTIKETAAALELNEKTLRTRLSRLRTTVSRDAVQEGDE